VGSRLAPLVWLHPDDRYRPMSVSTFVGGSRLRWTHGGGCPDHQDPGWDHPDLARLGAGGYSHQLGSGTWPDCSHTDRRYTTADRTAPFDSDLPHQPEGFFLDLDNNARHGTGTAADTYYEFVPDRSLTFWFFYGFNDAPGGGAFNHEGDWERLNIELGPANQPRRVVYHQHGYACILPWAEVRRSPDGHPLVYSAIGTHASYPHPGDFDIKQSPFGTDHAAAGGPDWKTWTEALEVTGRPWYGYGGGWGEVGTWGYSTGPAGPSPHRRGAPSSFDGLSHCE